MSRYDYKGKLYVHMCETDGHMIDEAEVLRDAVMLLTFRAREMFSDEEEAFKHPDRLREVTQTIADLAEMLRYREEERDQEEEKAQPQA